MLTTCSRHQFPQIKRMFTIKASIGFISKQNYSNKVRTELKIIIIQQNDIVTANISKPFYRPHVLLNDSIHDLYPAYNESVK